MQTFSSGENQSSLVWWNSWVFFFFLFLFRIRIGSPKLTLSLRGQETLQDGTLQMSYFWSTADNISLYSRVIRDLPVGVKGPSSF